MKAYFARTLLLASLAFGYSACTESEKEDVVPTAEDTNTEQADTEQTDTEQTDTEQTDPGNAIDDDGDGQSEDDGDCNDEDASIYSGATDDLVDGIDQNCDGRDGPECSNDDSFAQLSPAFAEAGITSCDNVFEGNNLSCSTDLSTLDPALAEQTIADYCGCTCPANLHQEPPYCVTLTMMDSGGDGWNGAYVAIDLVVYELTSGSETSVEVCNVELSGCTGVFYVRGQKPTENAWNISLHGYRIVSGANNSARFGDGCSFFGGSCSNCQSQGIDRMYCGDGNYGGIWNGCATIGDGNAECNDGRDEVGGTYTCDPYNYFPPE